MMIFPLFYEFFSPKKGEGGGCERTLNFLLKNSQNGENSPPKKKNHFF
jgi:hypothetical protein